MVSDKKNYKPWNVLKILLDIDGVLSPATSCKSSEMLEDGFYEFNQSSVDCLNELIDKTKASIVLISSHRTTKTVEEWVEIFKNRNVIVNKFEKVNNKKDIDKVASILNWFTKNEPKEFIIIDDDLKLSMLPKFIAEHIIYPKASIGLTKEDLKNYL